MNASNKPAITMSSLDWERIDRLLRSPEVARDLKRPDDDERTTDDEETPK